MDKPLRKEFTIEQLAAARRTLDGLHQFPPGKRLRTLERAVTTLAGGLCDIAPSRFERFDADGYFTIDADWVVPALCRAVRIEDPILEPCAGRGHLVVELRARGFEVDAADLYVHDDPLIPDIVTDADVFDLDSLSGYRGCHVATLARTEWASAQERRALVHEHPQYAGEVRLTKRPVWVRPVTKVAAALVLMVRRKGSQSSARGSGDQTKRRERGDRQQMREDGVLALVGKIGDDGALQPGRLAISTEKLPGWLVLASLATSG